ncbi:MAG TPA: sensor histidine kinase [Candidatus Melainabacteria bacterium]|nr:sensor histidine kinase [Candidatus Melainabacteria bacterium]HIN67340.1 sensor histidine kinase [Candidatus Obscuribacterales bacterium]
MRVSIRKQLLILFMPVLIGLFIASAIVSYLLVSSYSSESFDKDLISSADSVVGRLRVKNGKVTADLPPAAIAFLKHDVSDRLYYRVMGSNGERITGDSDLPEPSSSLQLDEPHLATVKIGGKEVRIAEIKVDVDEPGGDTVVVQVAETTKVRSLFQQKLLASIAIPQLLMLTVGLIALWYGVTKILTPLGMLQAQIRSRSQSDLSAVSDGGVPEEVIPLVDAINHLLSRLREDLKAHQRFIANAAHQLRTPLAGLKTYSSIGSEMNDKEDLKHVVKEIDTGIDRASRLVGQMLALARTDGGDQNPSQKTQVDLNFIVSDVTAELIERAVLKDLELVYESSQEPAVVYGEQTGLRNLVSNLVENALLYTPNGGKVKVQVKKSDRVTLRVLDTGTGIPEEERGKVFERFYRIDGTSGSGSGLGLSIVQEVANAHNAKISIDTPNGDAGTIISVEFPQTNGKNHAR